MRADHIGLISIFLSARDGMNVFEQHKLDEKMQDFGSGYLQVDQG